MRRLTVLGLADAGACVLMLTGSLPLVAVGCALHLALVVAAFGAQPEGSRRWLSTAWMLTLPGIGLFVATVTMAARGAGSLQEFQRGQVPAREATPPQIVRMIAGHVPICERLVSGVSRTRRTALNALASRRDADAVEILRWAVRYPDSELALDAALALDELVDAFESRRVETRARLAHVPSFDNLVEAGDVVLDALWSRLVDDAMIAALADEAGSYFTRARVAEPDRAPELAERLAKLALVTQRPHEALEHLRAPMQQSTTSRSLRALYNQAVAKARRFTTIASSEVYDAAS